jgi:catalase
LFSYPDTQRHRLGPNYALIPVNCPFSGKPIANYQRDGAMRVDSNGGARPNYSPNGRGPVADSRAAEAPAKLTGSIGRTEYLKTDRANDFEQAGLLYRVMHEDERARLIATIAGHLAGADKDIQARQIQHFTAADKEYGVRVARALGAGNTEL